MDWGRGRALLSSRQPSTVVALGQPWDRSRDWAWAHLQQSQATSLLLGRWQSSAHTNPRGPGWGKRGQKTKTKRQLPRWVFASGCL